MTINDVIIEMFRKARDNNGRMPPYIELETNDWLAVREQVKKEQGRILTAPDLKQANFILKEIPVLCGTMK